jgi:uncharacterized protein
MRDGTVLRADVYRPVTGGDRPVLLHRSPYDKQIAQSDLAYPHPAWYAAHGYVVVAQDVRGRWRSDGDFYPFLHEADDGWHTVEWAARLPGCDGRVAMYGFSYSGATQLLAAAGRPQSLAAVCPALTASQFYEGWTYRGGALAQAFVSSWAAYLATGEAVRRGDNDALEGLDTALLHAREHFWADPAAFPHLDGGLADYYRDWLAHPTYDDYWRRWSIDTDYGRLKVPALHIAGLYDSFLSGTVRNFVGMRRGASGDHARERQKLLIAPFTHMPWWPVWDANAAAGANAVDDWQLRYLAEVLDGSESGVFDHPVTAWVLGHGWRDFGDWPPPEGRRRTCSCTQADARTRPSATAASPRRRPPGSRRTSTSTTPPCRRQRPAVTPAASTPSRRWDPLARPSASANAASSFTPPRRSRPTSTSWAT